MKKLTDLLKSRKVLIALATIISAVAAQYGFGVSEETVFTIVAMGASVIGGIAIEDAGAKASNK